MTTNRKARSFSLALALLAGASVVPNGCKSSDDSDDRGNTPGLACTSDKDCREQDLLCDTSRRVCVECLTTDHCGDSQLCVIDTCVNITPCTSSRDCPDDQVCSDLLQRCVECVADVDCADGQVCAGELCRPSCESDKDCAKFDLLCAAELGYCVDCSAHTDCSEDQHCSPVGACVPDVCTPDSTRCENDQLLTCNDLGSGFGAESCNGACVEEDDEASCETGGGEAGGPSVSPEGGAPSTPPGEGGATDPGEGGMSAGGADSTGGVNAGGTASGAGGMDQGTGGSSPGGNSATGGTSATGGSGTGGSGTGGTGGDPGPLDPVTEACALLTTCPACCEEVGIFALGAGDPPPDITLETVTSWSGTASSATANFSFTAANQVGVIYFALNTLVAFSDISIIRTITGGTFEMALSRDGGESGCVYQALNPGWALDGCWGLSSSSWDQIEVRVNSLSAGPASITVTGIAYE